MPENKFLVGSQGEQIVIRLPMRSARMSKEDALTLAAWLVAMAETEQGQFQAVLAEVENS